MLPIGNNNYYYFAKEADEKVTASYSCEFLSRSSYVANSTSKSLVVGQSVLRVVILQFFRLLDIIYST